MIDNHGFIFFAAAAGADPASDRFVLERAGVRNTIVAVSDLSAVTDVAVELKDGAKLIELCGACGPVWTARVIEATGGRVPVGSVAFGAESVPGLTAAIPAHA